MTTTIERTKNWPAPFDVAMDQAVLQEYLWQLYESLVEESIARLGDFATLTSFILNEITEDLCFELDGDNDLMPRASTVTFSVDPWFEYDSSNDITPQLDYYGVMEITISEY